MTDELPRPSKAPCGSCPYRRDVPSGVWDASEYEKLPTYDGDTLEQIVKEAFPLFYCHQNDGHLCAGWVGCHDTANLLAMRINPVHPECFDYVSPVPLFSSGAEAAAHGMAEIDSPGRAARQTIGKLEAKLERVQYRLTQDGMPVASAEGPGAEATIAHYAMVYRQDGPCHVERKIAGRWKKVIWETVDDGTE